MKNDFRINSINRVNNNFYIARRCLFIIIISLLAISCGTSSNNHNSSSYLSFSFNKAKLKTTTKLQKSDHDLPAELTAIIITINDAEGNLIQSFDLLQIKENTAHRVKVSVGQQVEIISVAKAGDEVLYSGRQIVEALKAGETRNITLLLDSQITIDLSFKALSVNETIVLAVGSINKAKFDATIDGLTNTRVSWLVNELPGGNNEWGVIDTDGEYSPPDLLPDNANIQIKFQPESAPSFSRIIDVVLINDDGTGRPVIRLKGDAEITLSLYSPYTEPGAEAFDLLDGVLTAENQSSIGIVDTNTIGLYSITYNASDNSELNAIPVTRTINVVSEFDPLLDTDNDGIVDGTEILFGSRADDADDIVQAATMLGQTSSQGFSLSDALFDSGAENNLGPYALNSPSNAAVDTVNRRIFVSDTANHRILVFPLDTGSLKLSSRKAIAVLGQTNFEHNDDNKGKDVAADSLSSPRKGNFFSDTRNNTQWFAVAEKNNHRVLFYDVSNGITNGMDAVKVLGQTDFISNLANRGGAIIGCAAETIDGSVLYQPKSVYIKDIGTQTFIFVADTSNNRILVWDISEGGINGLSNGQAADYVLGQPNFQTRGSDACGDVAANTLDDPRDMALWNNMLIVADEFNDRVVVYNLQENGNALVALPQPLAASYVIGQTDFISSSSNRGDQVAAINTLDDPISVTIKENYLFIADELNNRVVVYDMMDINSDPNTVNANYVFGQPDFISGANQIRSPSQSSLDSPYGVSIAGDNLLVVESSGDRMVAYDIKSLSNNISTQAYGPDAYNLLGQTNNLPGEADTDVEAIFTAEGSNDTNAVGLENPAGLTLATVAGKNYLIVADEVNFRVMVYETDANWTPLDLKADFVLGDNDFEHSDSNISASETGFVVAVHYDNISQTLFIADASHHRVLGFDLSNGFTQTMNATTLIGQPDFTTGQSNRGGNTSSNSLNNPLGLTVGSIDQIRYLFIADNGNQRILIYDINDGLKINQLAKYVLGQPDFVSTNISDGNSVIDPRGLTFDNKTQNLIVADGTAARVLIWNLSLGISNALSPITVIGQDNFLTTGANNDTNNLTSANRFNTVTDVAIDPTLQMLWVADFGNNRVLGFNLIPGIKTNDTAISVIGQTNFIENFHYICDARTAYSLHAPNGIVVEPDSGKVFIAQNKDNRVVVLKRSFNTFSGQLR